MWVEVRVEDNNGICSVKVDANTASSRGQKVDENIRAGFIEFINALLTERARCVTILRGTVSDSQNNQSIPAPVEDA
jgi:hypothetical protein